MDSKSQLVSKTNILGVLTFGAGLFTYVAGTDLLVEYPQVASYLLMGAGIIGVIIRQFTKVAVSGFGPKK